MGQVKSAVSHHAKKHRAHHAKKHRIDSTMLEDPPVHCSIHSPSLMKKSCAWESCWSQFHDAIVKGRLDTCRQLLTSEQCATPMCLGMLSPAYRLRQLDAIAFGKLRTSALHMAALYRRPDFVQLLLEHGSEATVMDGFGRTPAAVLLEHWPRVTIPSPHSPPVPPWGPHVTLADHPNHSNTLLQLWAAQAEESGEEREHRPPGQSMGREMALFRQQVMVWRARSACCLTLLLKHGLGVNDVADRRRASTLLHIAARYDLVDVIELILNSWNGESHHSVRTDLLLEKCQYCKTTEKAEAAEVGGSQNVHPKHAQEVVDPSRPPHQSDSTVQGRIKRAVVRRMRSVVMKSHNCKAGWMRHQNRKNRLCQQGQTYRPTDSCTHKLRRKTSSAVSVSEHHALSAGQESVVDAKSKTEDVETPPMAADLEVLNGTAKTPLAVAVDRGSLNAAHCLLSHGADVFTSDFYGRTILHFLSERDVTFDLLMQEVVQQGVDVHRVDNGGNTALHVAAYMGNINKVAFLLQVGALPDHINMAGKTPLFLAFQRRDPATRQIILLFLLSSTHVKVRDKLGRVPSLLQREENECSYRQLNNLHKTSNTLLRRCVISVRRSVGLSRLMDMAELGPLPCPVSIQRALFGEEERKIVETLKI